MKYMLIIYGNEDLWTSLPPDQMHDLVRRTDALNQALVESGEMVGAFGVADQTTSKLVSVAAGEPTVTDGPYMEAKEYIGSFTIVDVEDEARALQIAAENPASELTGVEVRALLHGGTADEL
jgi:hypothetical protein